jgi:hypothetical protein
MSQIILKFLFLSIYLLSNEQKLSKDFIFEEKKIQNREITIETNITGVTQAYDEYDIKAPIDGEIISLNCELLDVVKKSQNIVKMASGDLGALLRTVKTEKEKKEILKRWDGMFRYTYISSPYDGIVTKINYKNGQFVNREETILTISKKMRVIAKNTDKLYMTPQTGLNAIINTLTGRYKLTLISFTKENTEGYYRMLFDFDEIPSIKVGEKISAKMLLVKKTSTRVVPNEDIIEQNGKKYLLIEILPGVISEKETEIESFGFNYLKIKKKEGK